MFFGKGLDFELLRTPDCTIHIVAGECSPYLEINAVNTIPIIGGHSCILEKSDIKQLIQHLQSWLETGSLEIKE